VDQAGNPSAEETGVTAPGGWIPGGPILDGAGALCFRYRFLYHLLKQRDEVVPLFVSEFYAGGGYDPANKADVVARMQWYDGHLGADTYVLGFGPFTLGPVPGWEQQDYEPFYEGEDGLVAYMIARAALSQFFRPPALKWQSCTGTPAWRPISMASCTASTNVSASLRTWLK
jgi:hypothetical protein